MDEVISNRIPTILRLHQGTIPGQRVTAWPVSDTATPTTMSAVAALLYLTFAVPTGGTAERSSLTLSASDQK